MKVQILVTKKVPGAKRVEWPEIPEWVWKKAQEIRSDVFVELRGGTVTITPAYPSVSSEPKCYRIYGSYTRKVIDENITDGPWLIQEPDREVPLTVEELQAKFPTSDWLLMVMRGRELWCVNPYALNLTWTSPATIIALNRQTLECVKIAEVVE